MPARVMLDDGDRLCKLHRLLVWTFRSQRIENVDYGEYPGDTRDCIAHQSVGITGSVKSLVVVPYRACRTRQPLVVLDDLDTQERMRLHDPELVIGQLSRFEQNAVGNADFSHIVKKGPRDQIGDFTSWQFQCFGKRNRIERHSLVMGVGIGIAFGARAPQGPHPRQMGVQQAARRPH